MTGVLRGGVLCAQIAAHLPHPVAVAFEVVWSAPPGSSIAGLVQAQLRAEFERVSDGGALLPVELATRLRTLVQRVRDAALVPDARVDCLHALVSVATGPGVRVWRDMAVQFACLLDVQVPASGGVAYV